MGRLTLKSSVILHRPCYIEHIYKYQEQFVI